MTSQPQSRATGPAEHLRALEEQLLQPATRKSPAAIASLLADDFCEFGSSGRIYTMPEIITELAAESPCSFSLVDFACRLLAPEIALVTYRTTRTQQSNSKEISSSSLRSSIWIHRDGRWQLLFHQGTRT